MSKEAEPEKLQLAITEIADLAGIELANRAGFENAMSIAVQNAQTPIASERPPKDKALRELKLYHDAATLLLRLFGSRGAVGSTKNWDENELAKTQFFVALSQKQRGHTDQTQSDWLQALNGIVATLDESISGLKQRNYRGPVNAQKQATDQFIRAVIIASTAAGGHLTSSRKGGEDSGTLPRSLRMLEAFLPNNFFPDDLPRRIEAVRSTITEIHQNKT